MADGNGFARNDYIVVGQLQPLGSDRYNISFELYNVLTRQRLLGYQFSANKPGLRLASHQAADMVFEKILGIRGAFATRVAYISVLGSSTLSTYAERVVTAFDVAAEITGSDSVNLLGMCAGGITASTVLSHLALRAPDRVNSASFGVTLLDFAVPAMVGMMNSRPLLAVAKARSRRSGVLDGQSLAAVFTWMRPNDLVWNYWVNNYLMGKRPPAFDILAWNADKTNLPSALHAQFLEIFAGNSLVHAGDRDG